jgi:hypothetical protein
MKYSIVSGSQRTWEFSTAPAGKTIERGETPFAACHFRRSQLEYRPETVGSAGRGPIELPTNYVFQLRPPAVEGDAWTESAVYTFRGTCGGGGCGCEWYPLNAALAIGTN